MELGLKIEDLPPRIVVSHQDSSVKDGEDVEFTLFNHQTLWSTASKMVKTLGFNDQKVGHLTNA
jgi:hypothetical protein